MLVRNSLGSESLSSGPCVLVLFLSRGWLEGGFGFGSKGFSVSACVRCSSL